MPAARLDAFQADALDHAASLLGEEGRQVLHGVRRVVAACHEVDKFRGEAAGISEAYFSPGDAARDRIVDLTERARKSLGACVFTITDDRIAGARLRAHEREITDRRAMVVVRDTSCSGGEW